MLQGALKLDQSKAQNYSVASRHDVNIQTVYLAKNFLHEQAAVVGVKQLQEPVMCM